MSTHYVVIGTGIAALEAAEAIRGTDAAGPITMIGEEDARFYSRPALAYLLDGMITEAELWIRPPEYEQTLGLRRLCATVRQLDTGEHRIALEDGSKIGYDRLLVATGAATSAPDFPGARLDGVVHLDGLAGARSIIGRARRGLVRAARAVVTGGGSTALEIVEGLHHRGVETHYFMRGDRYWARVLDQLESDLIEQRLRAAGVRLHHRTEIARAEGLRGKLRAVVTQSGERIPCDMLAIAIGVRPRLAVARTGGLAIDRGIITDNCMRTSAADVFAAGDVAQVSDSNGPGALDTLWHSALQQGRSAGLNMAGVTAPYRPRLPLNVTRIAGVTASIIGAVDGGDDDPDLLTLTRGQSERWRAEPHVWALRRHTGENRVRLMIGRRQLSGAVIMGDQAAAAPLSELMQAQVDISGIREQLEAQPEHALALLLKFHHEWRQHVAH